jgi:glutamyl-tRNA synthetase
LPDAVRNAVLAIGIGETDISFSWDNLYAENRKLVDPVANRYFFVPQPLKLEVGEAPHHTSHAMLHPADPSRGLRQLAFTGTVLIPEQEITSGAPMVRLKDLFNVRVLWDQDAPKLIYAGDALAEARAVKAPIIQWLPAQNAIACTLRTQEGDIRGACEPVVKMNLGMSSSSSGSVL